MSKQRSLVVDYAVFLLIRLAICVVQAVPFERPLPWGLPSPG